MVSELGTMGRLTKAPTQSAKPHGGKTGTDGGRRSDESGGMDGLPVLRNELQCLTGGGTGRSHVQTMAQGQPMLKISTVAGWKWARCEDTRWMFNLWLNDELNGTIFGLTKEDLHDSGR